MSSDLTFLTNEPGKSLRDRFGILLGEDTRFFDCLVGYFFISGFYKLYTALENVEKIRILVGLRTDRPAYDLLQRAKAQDELALKSHASAKEQVAEDVLGELEKCDDNADIDHGAVEIAKLRLWLSLVVDEEETKQIKPLPNLDYKIVAGNSLFGVEKTLFNEKLFRRLEKLKPIYFDEPDRQRKEAYRREIGDLIHELTNGKETFDFEIYFSEVLHKNNGFAVVIANPPYIFPRESAKKGLKDEDKQYFYKHYELAEYQVNLYPLFIEKSTQLLQPGGCLCFITPNNWLTINTNKTMRKFVLGQSSIAIVNFYARVFESADVDSSIIVFKKSAENRRVRLFEYTNDFHFIRVCTHVIS